MRIIFLPLLMLWMLCSSCFEITENLALNKDGSGKYSMKMDMSGLFKDPMMKGMMAAGDEKDQMKNMDTVIHFKDMPDSVIADNPELWKRVKMKVFSNEQKEQLFTTISLDFKSVDEIGYLSKNMDKVMNSAKAGPLSGDKSSESATTGFLPEGLTYMLSGKELRRISVSSEVKEGAPEDLEMMKGFLGNAKYIINMEFPGKVKKVTIPNANVKGKKVTIEAPLIEMMDNKLVLDGLVRYK